MQSIIEQKIFHQILKKFKKFEILDSKSIRYNSKWEEMHGFTLGNNIYLYINHIKRRYFTFRFVESPDIGAIGYNKKQISLEEALTKSCEEAKKVIIFNFDLFLRKSNEK